MNLWQRFRQWLQGEQNVYYIGGSDVLPPPLSPEELSGGSCPRPISLTTMSSTRSAGFLPGRSWTGTL